ncbi:MAG: LacI family DNA-binding transcriptional regulator [Desulfobulbaceae bacterium]|nr:LacI family DNA-binding transcriptional regulator [Desulfobulbaceae bacterium]
MTSGKRAVTIKDVSRLANVSPATVSFVMNNRPGVSAKTRARVLQIAEALDYKPNLVARSLVNGRSKLIAMLISSTRNPLFPELADGVDQALKAKGYTLSIISTNDEEQLESREIAALRYRGFDGVIISSTLQNNRELNKLVESGFPVVSVLRRDYSCKGLDYIVLDGIKGGYMATEHLIRLGHRRIGIIKGPQKTSTGLERLKGALYAMADYGIQIPDTLIREGDFFKSSGYAAAMEMMRLPQEERPSALYACNDDMAIGAFEALWELNVRVPEDVALIGFNNTAVTALKSVSISTISLQKASMGKQAANRLIEIIENKKDDRKTFRLMLEPELIVRRTCGFALKGKYLVDKVKDEDRRIFP